MISSCFIPLHFYLVFYIKLQSNCVMWWGQVTRCVLSLTVLHKGSCQSHVWIAPLHFFTWKYNTPASLGSRGEVWLFVFYRYFHLLSTVHMLYAYAYNVVFKNINNTHFTSYSCFSIYAGLVRFGLYFLLYSVTISQYVKQSTFDTGQFFWQDRMQSLKASSSNGL